MPDPVVVLTTWPCPIFHFHGRLQEELAEARKSGQDAVQQLAEARSRCLNAEELVAKAHEAKEMLKHSLKEAVRVRDAQTKELCAARDRLSTLFEKDSRDAASQTATDKQRFDLERKLKRSQADLQLATADLAHSKDQTTKLRQELVDSTAQTTVAKDEARRNEELVSAKQEEIIGIGHREQVMHMASGRVSPSERTSPYKFILELVLTYPMVSSPFVKCCQH